MHPKGFWTKLKKRASILQRRIKVSEKWPTPIGRVRKSSRIRTIRIGSSRIVTGKGNGKIRRTLKGKKSSSSRLKSILWVVWALNNLSKNTCRRRNLEIKRTHNLVNHSMWQRRGMVKVNSSSHKVRSSIRRNKRNSSRNRLCKYSSRRRIKSKRSLTKIDLASRFYLLDKMFQNEMK